jgi:MscS family membrane protein
VIGAYVAFRLLATGHPEWVATGDKIFAVLVTMVIAWTAFRVIDAVATWFAEKAAGTDTRLDDQLIPLLRKATKVFVGVLTFVLVAQNLGYSVSGLLAGLGIGGLALAMAAKDTLANFFGSVMILTDRPFHVGDWITLPGADGVVEEIGLRSTRIRTFAKTLVSIPNSQLANETVENHSLMPKRRIKFELGVTYDTTADQMRGAVARIEEYLQGNPDIHQEFMLVKFTEFANSSLNIFVYCFTVTTDWTRHLTVRQEVNLAIMDILTDLGLEVAFPTRTVHLAQEQEAVQ